ncbi:MAG: hypothetical protein ACYCZA_07510 [Thiobacillus sp.]
MEVWFRQALAGFEIAEATVEAAYDILDRVHPHVETPSLKSHDISTTISKRAV